MIGRCWAEIDLSKLKNNLKIYRNSLSQHMEIMAVVKADAYGHGDTVIAECLSNNGIDNFAVSNIEEAIRLRKSGILGQILILGYTPLNRVSDIEKYDITQTLLSEEYADAVMRCGKNIKCQFAIDTGMRRIGLNADDVIECERIIRKYQKLVNGLFTHLCVADTEYQNEFTKMQIDKFEAVCNRVADLDIPYCHCMNSAGGIWHTSAISCFARLGVILYGLKPDYNNTLPCGIVPILSWKSVVSMVKQVNIGNTLGYGRSFTVKHPMTIATITTGYADGYPRILSNKGWVLINKHKAPIIGRVCMDQMMVDVSAVPDVQLGSEVILLGRSGDQMITADDLAHLCGTIGYEIVCNISKRVERVYINSSESYNQ